MSSLGKTTILVINDEPDALDLMVFILTRTGYSVLTAPDGSIGLETAKRTIPDLIISDVMMPGISGIELCRLLRAETLLKTIPIILVSAIYKDSETAIEGLQAGADDFIEVPFEHERLVAKTARLLERKHSEQLLVESESRFRNLSNSAPVLIWLNGIKGCEYVNEQYLDFLGVKNLEDIQGLDWAQFIHPDDQENYVNAYVQAFEKREEFFSQFRFRRNDGTYRWMTSSGTPRYSESGQFLGYVGSTVDIHDLKSTEQALRESEERSRLLIEGATDYAIFRITPDGLVASWNTGAERTFGYKENEIIGQPHEILFTPEDREKGVPQKELETASKEGRAENERWHIRKDGKLFFASGIMTQLREGNKGFVKITSDQTKRIEAEQAEREKEMLVKLVHAQEDERKRIARDLHDELGQQLIALRMELEQVRKLCENNKVLSAKVDAVQIIARSLDHGVDFLAWELRPSVLDHLGLLAALDKYVKEWSYYSGVSSELIASSKKIKRFSPETETNLYRIVQEALNNIHKHAKANKVNVILDKREDTLVLIIEDDGIGFNPKSKKNSSRGLGLTGIKERAVLIGGNVEIESARKKGTTIYVRIPLLSRKTYGIFR
jgi:PAS domain S-box-containing protein